MPGLDTKWITQLAVTTSDRKTTYFDVPFPYDRHPNNETLPLYDPPQVLKLIEKIDADDRFRRITKMYLRFIQFRELCDLPPYTGVSFIFGNIANINITYDITLRELEHKMSKIRFRFSKSDSHTPSDREE